MPSFESPSRAEPRYQLTPLSDGGAMVIVRSHARPMPLILLSFVAIAAIVIAIAVCVSDTSLGVVQASVVVLALLVVLYVVSIIATSAFGIERYMITATSLTRHWKVLCLRGAAQYDFAHMGPIHYVASSWVANKTSDRTAHVRIGFRYGAQDVQLDNFLNENEVDIFLQDISPYLPEHVMPRISMVTSTAAPNSHDPTTASHVV
ncbi:Aste57867_12636 [Aphanomyces stellatus]|uniref:Aste57867_12636 protein n=1 Tax=Aphanomyces stellatus TaxID=120398 RepID=A0A485KW41_9STRA|nr:hypothetical protein As57867_012590 [Aphanomyces stellatus]VFT89486.1 Aste57867_12636 [Aphanomyces stellatus]